jgi:predicted RNA-binding protein with TRAM domain
MVLEIGEKVHIMVKRAFEGDSRRHFVGEIKAIGDNAIRVEGYVFIFDESSNEYLRKPELRIRIFSLIDARILINVIPILSLIEKVTYRLSEENNLVVTDGENFQLDINEFGSKR